MDRAPVRHRGRHISHLVVSRDRSGRDLPFSVVHKPSVRTFPEIIGTRRSIGSSSRDLLEELESKLILVSTLRCLLLEAGKRGISRTTL